MNKKIFFSALLLPLLFACTDNDSNGGSNAEADSLIDVVLFMSDPGPDNPSQVPDVFVMLPDGSKTKLLVSRHAYAYLLDISMPAIGNDGKTLFYIFGQSESGEMYFLDLATMRITDRYSYADPVSVEGSFWFIRPKISPDMKEIYGINFPSGANAILVLNRETKTMTTVTRDDWMEPKSLMMSGDKSAFIFASRDYTPTTAIKGVDITGRNLRNLITLPTNTLAGSTLIGPVPNTNRYIYSYRYIDSGKQYLRLVRTDLNNSFSTVLETIDYTGKSSFSGRLSVSRDGNMLVYSYQDVVDGYNIEHIVIRHYENDQLINELVVPTFSYLNDSRSPVFCVISKAIFDQLPDM